MTLPAWVWIIYYCFIAISIIYGFIALFKGTLNRFLSLLTIIVSIIIPILFITYSIERSVTQNEFDYFVSGLLKGNMVSWMLLVMIIYVGFWWVILIKRIVDKK